MTLYETAFGSGSLAAESQAGSDWAAALAPAPANVPAEATTPAVPALEAGLPAFAFAFALVLGPAAIMALAIIMAVDVIDPAVAGVGLPEGAFVVVTAVEPAFSGNGALLAAPLMAPGVVVAVVPAVAVLVPGLAGCDSSPHAALSHSALEHRPARPFPLNSFIGMLFLLWRQSRQCRLRAVSSRAQRVGCHVPIWPRFPFIAMRTCDCAWSGVAL
jgi:hypothetical protein